MVENKELIIPINTDLINSWLSFHRACKILFGFPDYYGNNMNAWIDCMAYIDEPETGMTTVNVPPGNTVIIELKNVSNFKSTHEEIYNALIKCTAFVNERKVEDKTGTKIEILEQ